MKKQIKRFSSERTIEEAMLEWLRNMIEQFGTIRMNHPSRVIREGAANYLSAYRSCRDQLLSEIQMRRRR